MTNEQLPPAGDFGSTVGLGVMAYKALRTGALFPVDHVHNNWPTDHDRVKAALAPLVLLGDAQREIDRLKAQLEKIELKAQAGLCYFTLESAREFLKDVRDEVATALGVQAPQR
jgi:hypothetical protein